MDSLNLKMGAKVYSQEGESCGSLAHVVVEPAQATVTDVIVESGIAMFKKAHTVPVSAVESATKDGIRLVVPSDQVDRYPEFKEVEIEEPIPGAGGGPSQGALGAPTMRRRLRQGVVTGRAVVDTGTKVVNLDREIGRVDHVWVDRESGEIASLAVRRGLLRPELLLVPGGMVEEVGERTILLSASNKEVENLTRYTEDTEAEILAEVGALPGPGDDDRSPPIERNGQ